MTKVYIVYGREAFVGDDQVVYATSDLDDLVRVLRSIVDKEEIPYPETERVG